MAAQIIHDKLANPFHSDSARTRSCLSTTATLLLHRACHVGFLGFPGEQEAMKNNWQLMFHEQGKLSYRGRIPLNPIAAASANEDGQQFQHFQRGWSAVSALPVKLPVFAY